MATVDASIPLSVKPFQVPDQLDAYGKAMTLQNLGQESQMKSMQLQQLKSQMMGEQTLADLYKDPSMMTTEGGVAVPNAQGMAKVMAASPETGMGLNKQILAMKQAASKLDETTLQSEKLRTEALGNAIEGVRTTYTNALQQTKNPQQAAQIGLQSRNQAIDGLVNSKQMTPEAAAAAKAKPFDINDINNMAQQGTIHAKILEEEHQRRMESIAQQHLGIAQQGVAERKRHDTTMETAAQGGDVNTYAAMVANHQVPALSGFVMKTPWGQRVMSKVAEINPQYNAAEFDSSKATQIAFSKGKQGDTVRSFNVGLKHLDTLSQAVDALGNGNIKQLNRIANAYAEETGRPAPTNFDTVKNVVAAEIVKAISGAGGAVADRDKAQATILDSQSPAVLKGAIEQYKQLMNGQLAGLRKQYEAGTGRKDFNKYLTPEALKEETSKVVNMDQQDQNSQPADGDYSHLWGQ